MGIVMVNFMADDEKHWVLLRNGSWFWIGFVSFSSR
jgi:hypothetical protein